MKNLIVISLCFMVAFSTTTAGAAFRYNFFECWPSASTSGPPYPTGPLKKNIYLETDLGGLQPTSIISAGIQGVNPGMSLQMTSHNGGGGDFAVDSFFDVFFTGGAGDFPAESFFDVFVEIDLPDESGTLLRKEPTIFSGESFFDVFVEIDIDTLGGTYQFLKLHVEHMMETDAPEPTSLTFNGRGIDLNEDAKVDPLESFFDVWFELSVENSSLINFAQPLVTMTLTGQIIPELCLPGDANNDGVVSADDYASVQGAFGNTGAVGILGDANCDGLVSADDYASVQGNFGATAGGIPAPEPATLSLLVVGGLTMLRRRRK